MLSKQFPPKKWEQNCPKEPDLRFSTKKKNQVMLWIILLQQLLKIPKKKKKDCHSISTFVEEDFHRPNVPNFKHCFYLQNSGWQKSATFFLVTN